MPPHETYIETHLGAGSVLLNKLPAKRNIGIDRDPKVLAEFRKSSDRFELVCSRAEDFLRSWNWSGNELVYCDPPYLPSTRLSQRVYKYEYSLEDHQGLLGALTKLPCPVILSGYRSDMYDELLDGWKRVDFSYASHVGGRIESLWLNFTPSLRHDSRYIGWDFRGREAFKRKRDRWKKRFHALPFDQKQAIFEDLEKAFRASKNGQTQYDPNPIETANS